MKMERGNEIDNAFARNCLTAYARHMWDGYLTPDHVIKLCSALELVESGDITRLIVTMPPRHSKTMNVGEFLPSWYLGRNPDKQIIYCTHSQDKANDVGRRVRNMCADSAYQEIFPGCGLSPDSTAKHRFNTRGRGVYYAIGRGGSITGKGADLLIVDDILKDHKEAASSHVRAECKKWYQSTASTRLQKDAAVILMGARWNKDDLIGWALTELADQNWVEIDFPARDERSRPLWPEMFDDAALARIETTLGTYFWNALYMQRPSEEEGNIFKRQNWRFYRELPPKFDIEFQSWDATFKETKAGSFVVGQVWGKIGADCYLVDQVRKRMGFTGTLKSFALLSNQYPKTLKKLVEDKANGPAIMSVLKRKIPGIVPVEPQGSKVARAEAVSPLQESGNVYLPHPSIKPWINDYVDEHADFPHGDFDDQVDATTQALSNMGGGDAIERLKRLLGEL